MIPKPVIYRKRASVVCVYGGKLLVLVAIDPASGRRYLLIPGGAVEEGETPLEAAERETMEETGYRVIAEANSELVRRYDFDWNGTIYDCLTHFFRATLAGNGEPQGEGLDSPYLLSREWIDQVEVEHAMAYHPVIQEAVMKLIGQDGAG
jgi:8-oxo-dGTP pyrophosphatase MutT (NUDIX family)